MELSDKCLKELQVVVDAEVKRRTDKLKQRVAGVEKNRAEIQQECSDVRRTLDAEKRLRESAENSVIKLDQELRESKASEKALKTALAEQPG